MTRPFRTFVGIDLGGSRGKSTAVSRLRWSGLPGDTVWVDDVATRHRGIEPWSDAVLVDHVTTLGEDAVVAIDAPLTMPACLRCTVPVCPGVERCEVPATVWLRTTGEELHSRSLVDRDRVVAVTSARSMSTTTGAPPVARHRLAPYTHRCTEVLLHYTRDLVSRDNLGQSAGPVAARAVHLRRVLGARGFELNRNLLEVSPRGTVHALFGPRRARGYKRDADPWNTRAAILESLSHTLRFSPQSRLSREEVLRNDHCFDALLSGYTAFLWARDDWQLPGEPFATDGFIWVPPAP